MPTGSVLSATAKYAASCGFFRPGNISLSDANSIRVTIGGMNHTAGPTMKQIMPSSAAFRACFVSLTERYRDASVRLFVEANFWRSIAMTHSPTMLELATSPQFQKWDGVFSKNVPMPPTCANANAAATRVIGMSSRSCTKSLAVVLQLPPRTEMMTTTVPVTTIVHSSGIANAADVKTPSP